MRSIRFRHLLVLLFLSLPAHGAARMGLVAVGTWGHELISAGGVNERYVARQTLGAGVVAEIPIEYRWEIELGALYAPRTDLEPSQRRTFSYFDFPALLRVYFTRMINLGAGGYYSLSSGGVMICDPSGANCRSGSYAANARTTDDMGLVGAAGFRLPLTRSLDLYLDGRYLYGLSNHSKIQHAEANWRAWQALAGFSFFL